MVQGFYTLEEAAQRLGMPTHDLSLMAQRREVRAFADRGTWRFRVEEIEELARRRGRGSDPELQLGDSGLPGGARKPAGAFGGEDYSADIFSGAEERTPEERSRIGPGSDSDVRLVPEGSGLELQVEGPTPPPGKPRTGVATGTSQPPDSDSDVKLVDVTPEDSDVPIGREPDRARAKSDSDVRLEGAAPKIPDSGVRFGPAGGTGKGLTTPTTPPTEEINLDDEMLKAEGSSVLPGGKSSPVAPAPPPFEISSDSPTVPKRQRGPSDTGDSSDFDLTPRSETASSSEFDLESSSDFELTVGAEESEMADAPAAKRPSDEAISFELAPDESGSSPRPVPVSKDDDSSSEFELTLDADEGLAPLEDSGLKATNFKGGGLTEDSSKRVAAGDSDLDSSDFELALDEDMGAASDEVVIDEDASASEATAIRASVLEDEGEELFPESEAVVEEGDLVVEDEAEEGELVPARAAAPAEWGAWAMLHVPTTLFLLFSGFLLFEMMRSVLSPEPTALGGPLFSLFSNLVK
jgi:hypothetical protein